MTPLEALHREIARTEAAVEWLQTRIAELDPDQLYRGTRSVRRVEDATGVKTITEAGNVRHELLQLFIDERRHLHALCRDALAVKTPERPTSSGGWPRAS